MLLLLLYLLFFHLDILWALKSYLLFLCIFMLNSLRILFLLKFTIYYVNIYDIFMWAFSFDIRSSLTRNNHIIINNNSTISHFIIRNRSNLTTLISQNSTITPIHFWNSSRTWNNLRSILHTLLSYTCFPYTLLFLVSITCLIMLLLNHYQCVHIFHLQ
jgi:hypothetical protein